MQTSTTNLSSAQGSPILNSPVVSSSLSKATTSAVGTTVSATSGSAKRPRRSTTGRRLPSAASTMSSNLDRPFVWSFVLVLMIYIVVTFLAYEKLNRSNSKVMVRNPPELEGNDWNHLQYHSFPLHVTKNDMEWIHHPGLQWVDLMEQRRPPGVVRPINDGLAKASLDKLPRKLLVPQFWSEAFASYYNKLSDGATGNITSVRQLLGEGGRRVMTPEEAALIGSFAAQQKAASSPNHKHADGSMLETIYASVASYRDYECTLTVQDLYERAQYPERIRVAVIDQSVTGVDVPCLTLEIPCEKKPEQALCRYRHLIDYFHVEAQLAVGPVFARHLAHRLYRGEYYAMQVDSHVRFTQNWDSDIIEQWKAAKNEYAVLTTYLSDIQGRIDPVTHLGTDPSRPIMCDSDFEGSGDYRHLRHGQQPEGPPGIHGQPTLHPFWAAGYSFARGHFIVQVPYDQYLPMVFQGEEISIGLRGFTYGYDYYAPEKGICFHIYANGDNEKKRSTIPMFWENSRFYSGTGEAAMKRLNIIIGLASEQKYGPGDWPQQDKEKYGLGHVRNPEKFFTTFGIHVKEQRVEHHLCHFVGKPMMKEFLPALRPNGMGLDYNKIKFVFVDQWKNEK